MAKVQMDTVFSGHEIVGFEEGSVVLSGVMMMKIMTAEGKPQWVMRHFGDPSYVEIIGALTVTLDHEQAEYLDGWVPDEEDG
jgi:hypothetical protein